MSTLRIAERFIALGGRLIVDPKGGLSFALSADKVLTMALTIRQRASAFRIKRAARVLAWRQTEEVAALATGTRYPDAGWLDRLRGLLTWLPKHMGWRLLPPDSMPPAWLAALVQIGGGYALASGRKLWLVVEDCDYDDLASVMRPLIGNPDRAEAIRVAIERRQNGDA